MSHVRNLSLTLTEQQYHALMSAADLYHTVMMDNGDGPSSVRAQTAVRAAKRLEFAWNSPRRAAAKHE